MVTLEVGMFRSDRKKLNGRNQGFSPMEKIWMAGIMDPFQSRTARVGLSGGLCLGRAEKMRRESRDKEENKTP